MTENKAGLDLLGILDRLTSVLIKARVEPDGDGKNPFELDDALVLLDEDNINQAYYRYMEPQFSMAKDEIKTSSAKIYKTKDNQILRVLFQVNQNIFFTYDVESVQWNISSGNNEDITITELIKLLDKNQAIDSYNPNKWYISSIDIEGEYIQLNIQIIIRGYNGGPLAEN